MAKLSISKPHVVIVEGSDEFHLFKKFLELKNIDNIQLINSEGVSNLPNHFKLVCLSEEFISKKIVSLSIIRDSDINPTGNAQSVKSIFLNSGLRGNISHKKFIKCYYPSSTEKLYCGFFMVPSDKRIGYLETILLEFMKTQDNYKCINDFYDCLLTNGFNLPSNIDKSRVQTYVSVHPAAVRLVGEAATADVWDFSHPAFTELLQFIEAQSKLNMS